MLWAREKGKMHCTILLSQSCQTMVFQWHTNVRGTFETSMWISLGDGLYLSIYPSIHPHCIIAVDVHQQGWGSQSVGFGAENWKSFLTESVSASFNCWNLTASHKATPLFVSL